MPIEYEAKILDVDTAELTATLLREGAIQTGPTRLMRRRVYDISPGDQTRWIRLRDSGTEITLTIKEIEHDGIDGTTETEVRVDDFDATDAILEKLGYTAKSYQENRRTSFTLDGARIEIDEWPLIPPYLEIEGDSEADVLRIASRLRVTRAKLTAENTVKVYAKYGIDLNQHKVLTF